MNEWSRVVVFGASLVIIVALPSEQSPLPFISEHTVDKSKFYQKDKSCFKFRHSVVTQFSYSYSGSSWVFCVRFWWYSVLCASGGRTEPLLRGKGSRATWWWKLFSNRHNPPLVVLMLILSSIPPLCCDGDSSTFYIGFECCDDDEEMKSELPRKPPKHMPISFPVKEF